MYRPKADLLLDEIQCKTGISDLFPTRFYRDDCILDEKNNIYQRDPEVIKLLSQDPKKTLILSTHLFGVSRVLENVIPIKPFDNTKKDHACKYLKNFLVNNFLHVSLKGEISQVDAPSLIQKRFLKSSN